MKRKLSWHFYAVLSAVLALALAATAVVLRKTEFAYEMADLQAMRVAYTSAELKWKGKLPEEPVEYWYDGEAYTLVPASEPKPKPCGAGTRLRGGAVRAYQAETGDLFDAYSEAERCVGKLPRVTVWQENHALRISVDWVS